MKRITNCTFYYCINGDVIVTFENCATGKKFSRRYKTEHAARAQVTRFINKAHNDYFNDQFIFVS